MAHPLAAAAARGDWGAVRRHIQCSRPVPSHCCYANVSLLRYAARSGQRELVARLVDLGADVEADGPHLLNDAATAGHTLTCLELLRAGAVVVPSLTGPVGVAVRCWLSVARHGDDAALREPGE